MPSRRRLLMVCTGTAGTILAGCISGPLGDTGTGTASPTPSCGAAAPPEPTNAATSPRSYPDRPPELSKQSVKEFLVEYERAYQYNAALASNPNKIGRMNEFTVDVQSVSLDTNNGHFVAEVSGQLQSDIKHEWTRTTTPDTETETPLPIGHGPFETTYVVRARTLRREDVVVECW